MFQSVLAPGRCKTLKCAWCFETRVDGHTEEHCCNTNCLGGCTGPTAADCFVCKYFRDGDRCVDKCPPPATVQNYRLTLNVNFTYEFSGFCVSECPKTLLAEGTRCLSECPPGKYYTWGRFCIPCEENCPKVCYLERFSSLDASSLSSLENCTTLSGDLIISEESYSSGYPGRKPITTSEELWALHSLREVTGFVHLDLRKHPAPLQDLTFLENLGKIGGSHSRVSMAVVHGDIKFAGLHRLREAPHGDLVFMTSPELCYIQTIVTPKTIDKYHLFPNFRIQMYQLPSAAECEARGATCHPSCDAAFGCWGPRREDCLRCRSRSINGSTCVDNCTEFPGFYEMSSDTSLEVVMPPSHSNPMTTRLQLARLAAGHIIEEATHSRYGSTADHFKAPAACARCHPECAESCTGPGADQCTGACKHARNGNECVAECPHTTFLDPKGHTCIPCSSQCHPRKLSGKPVCTGTGTYPGEGGCTKCEIFLEFISFDGPLTESSEGLPNNSVRTQHGALLCMRGACPKGTFRTMESVDKDSRFAPFVEDGVHAVPVCRSCHSLCRTCTGYSVLHATDTQPGCLECHGFWFRDTCVKECPEDSTFQISLTHPPEVHKAFHFRQSLDSRGLFLSSKLSSPVRGSDAFPRPQLWTRHLGGRCLLCHPECLTGCWGPSAAHCHRCSHVRVWHHGVRQPDSSMWNPMGDVKTTYLLNKEAFALPPYKSNDKDPSHKATSMHFTCEASCPADMPYTSDDPLTGDTTCHSSSNSDSVYADRRRDESITTTKRLGASLVGPIAAVFIIFLICVTLTYYCKRHHKRLKMSFSKGPTTLRLKRLFDKVLRFYEEPKTGPPYRVVAYTSGTWSRVVEDETVGESGGSEERHAPSPPAPGDRSTWPSDDSVCPYWQDVRLSSTDDGLKSAFSNPICHSSYCYKTIYRRATRQQPNMGRLVLINLDDIHLSPNKAALGSGAFGSVYKGVWRVSDDIDDSQLPTFERSNHHRHIEVAVKILNELNGSADLHALLEEAKVMCSVRHRHCLQLLGVCLAGSQRYLVSEYIPNGSLDNYIRRPRNDLPHWLLLLWADQIADGMAYLQSVGIIHRDLATRNVLVKEHELLQITDFGLAKMLSGEEEEFGEVVDQSGRVPIRWLAIETLTSGRYSFKTDIWAYGVTLWEIFTFGQRPYSNIETKDIGRYVITGGRLPQPDICTLETYQRLLLACWRENPEERITFIDILRLLRSKRDTPEYFLHSRPASSLISTQTRTTRLSGAYSETTRRERDSTSSPHNGISFLSPSRPPIVAVGLCPRQHSNPLGRLPPRAPQNPPGTPESLPTTVEYATATNSSSSSSKNDSGADATVAPAEQGRPLVPNNSGGYVWPMPFTEQVESTVEAVGEYVGPLFQHPTDIAYI